MPGYDCHEDIICPWCNHYLDGEDYGRYDFRTNRTRTVTCDSCGKDYEVLELTYYFSIKPEEA